MYDTARLKERWRGRGGDREGEGEERKEKGN
jgi:hypothetical protein